MRTPPLMPEEFKGKITTNGGYTKNSPRKWTKEEINWCLGLKSEGHTIKDISTSTGRGEVSVSIKMKRLTKKDKTYNQKHVEEKYEANIRFLEHLEPETILDVFAGQQSFYNHPIYKVISNDKNYEADTTYHLDALKLLCKLYYENFKFDLVDLDPYGSAYECFDLAIKMAKKGLIITFGEMGHRRWKRLDFVKSHYGIHDLKEFNISNLIRKVEQIGRQNKKELTVQSVYNWRNISRVYWTIQPYKVTEQWDKNV